MAKFNEGYTPLVRLGVQYVLRQLCTISDKLQNWPWHFTGGSW
jgi:hypothetical protein